MPHNKKRGPLDAMAGWFDRNCLALGREMRLSYLPPLMVYLAAGISGLTAIVGTFFVKERLGLSAEFLAALGFILTRYFMSIIYQSYHLTLFYEEN